MITRKKKNLRHMAEHRITVQTSYGHVDIVNLKSVWVNEWFGTYRLMYSDEIYGYNCIYWSDDSSCLARYNALKQKLINAYNIGDAIVEL